MDTPALEDRTKNFNLEVSELDPRGWAGFEIFLTTSCCFACLGLACALSMAAAALFTSAREFTAQDCYARQCLVTKTTLLGLGKKSSTDAPCCNMISLLCELLLQLPASVGMRAPLGGGFFFLNSSDISSIVTNSTPSCFRKCSISLQYDEHDIDNVVILLTSHASGVDVVAQIRQDV
jgi:hypothetical protein